MRYWQIFVLPLVTILAACSDNNARMHLQLCSAEYRYNTEGADAAIAAMREVGNDREYVVGNNVARFLILRGAKTQNTNDFDKANAILDAMEPLPDDPEQVTARYISVLRFLATANGSNNNGAREELTQYCSESAEPEAECLHGNIMEIFQILGTSNGTTNKSSEDLANLFNQTYRAEFNDPSLDVQLDYSRSVVTSCGSHE
ncbi:hypothetical protein SAMN05660691_00553 [Rheinheimera pacifica]|uniref:Uncharacterized protein n=1 Tax=Rheinheimera pacifica TaxID=173990 RepID=A0A1H6JN95_9GAMM|nr:hypothetical protein [Rheinheimera pacifica]SEH63887.1 hypothetical protein SAMN05660691_00553 [Rheinheimera pacifica]